MTTDTLDPPTQHSPAPGPPDRDQPVPLPVFTTDRLTAWPWTGDEMDDLLAVRGDADATHRPIDSQALTRVQCETWLGFTQRNCTASTSAARRGRP